MNMRKILFDISKKRITYWAILIPISFFIICISIMIYNYKKAENDDSKLVLNRQNNPQLVVVKIPTKINYIDSICLNYLKCPTTLLSCYFKKYDANENTDSMIYFAFKNDSFEASVNLGDLNNDKKNENVFLLPMLNYGEEGDAFYFYDTIFPRLETNSLCAHRENIFLLEDINEDGIKEIGLYYSACSSRYKSIQVYSLIKNEWQQIGSSVFDILTKEPNPKEFKTFVKKLSKNKFKMKNFEDEKTYWKNYSIN